MKTGYLDCEQMNHFYQKVVDAVSILDGRVEALERTAADRCEIPKRPRRKLTIKVSA